MATVTINCTPCFSDWISCGIETIIVAATLAAETDYKWVLTNKESKYSGTATTDVDGKFTIPVADLPAGLLNPYAGEFILEVFTADDYCIRATWNDSAYCTPYDCINFDVRNGGNAKNTLGCECLEYLLTEQSENIILE